MKTDFSFSLFSLDDCYNGFDKGIKRLWSTWHLIRLKIYLQWVYYFFYSKRLKFICMLKFLYCYIFILKFSLIPLIDNCFKRCVNKIWLEKQYELHVHVTCATDLPLTFFLNRAKNDIWILIWIGLLISEEEIGLIMITVLHKMCWSKGSLKIASIEIKISIKIKYFFKNNICFCLFNQTSFVFACCIN